MSGRPGGVELGQPKPITSDAGWLLASTEDGEEEESSYRIEGSSLKVTSGDGTTGTETVYQRQSR